MIKNVTILGARESGFGAAMLASKKGYNTSTPLMCPGSSVD